MELIDKQELLDWIQNCWDWATVDGITSTTVLKQTMTDISQLPTVEAIPKADYENRLKADMVAMLTEIQIEIEDEAWKQGCASNNDREDEAYKIYYFIQQKIDTLKAESEETDG